MSDNGQIFFQVPIMSDNGQIFFQVPIMSDNGQIFFQVPIMSDNGYWSDLSPGPLAATWLVPLNGSSFYIQKIWGTYPKDKRRWGKKSQLKSQLLVVLVLCKATGYNGPE
jgi:hypothetical protein